MSNKHVIAELEARIKNLEEENRRFRDLLQTQQAIQHSQQHHQEMCYRVFQAALKAKLIYNIGACGNGGIPTFGAIVQKIEEACDNIAKGVGRG